MKIRDLIRVPSVALGMALLGASGVVSLALLVMLLS